MKIIVYIKKKIIAEIMRFFMYTMNFFISMDDKMILYLSFDGRSYSDNPKAIFETMLTDADKGCTLSSWTCVFRRVFRRF